MKTIVHKGGVYKESAHQMHKKCEKGFHWNEVKKKCMSLPNSLRKTIVHANKQTKNAVRSKSPDHGYAGSSHDEAGKEAFRKGFHQLAHKHFDKADEHYKRDDEIYRNIK